MYRLLIACLVFTLITITTYFLYINSSVLNNYRANSGIPEYNSPQEFEHFDNISGASNGCYIVPNIVHFIRFNQYEFSFIDAVCILAAFQNQRPDKIYIHTNVANFKGKYWEYLLNRVGLKEILFVKLKDMPLQIFGQKLSKQFLVFHSGDVARLQILMEYGGIYLDNDSYIVRSLDDFRRYEMTIGWPEGRNISNQVIIAHKNARFLKLWLETYRNGYEPKSWFYNAGIRPTREVLLKNPGLVHREKTLLAPYEITRKIYTEKWNDWRIMYAMHLYINHLGAVKKNLSERATYPVVFNEENIKNYPVSIRDMVDAVFPLYLKQNLSSLQ